MFMLNIIITLLGTVFFAFGFLVCFKKRYTLVSFLINDKSCDNDTYKEQIGLIFLMAGMLYIFAGIVGFVSASVWVSVSILLACTALIFSLFTHSTLKAKRI